MSLAIGGAALLAAALVMIVALWVAYRALVAWTEYADREAEREHERRLERDARDHEIMKHIPDPIDRELNRHETESTTDRIPDEEREYR